MKIKRNLYISDAEKFARNPESNCYCLLEGRWMDDEWTFVCEIEFDVQVDKAAIIELAKKVLDSEIGTYTAAINVLESRKAELLALPSPS